ncbi:MAG: hypothetical protein M5U28_31135 [Sandaracinaceae bacterium]|nr:hypothetical protein [Sandaracinaceae bacterium]
MGEERARGEGVQHHRLREHGDPRYGELRAAMLVCGDDDEACAVALSFAKDLGFDALRAGKLDRARLLEPLAVLWIQLAMGLGHGRDIAFGLLRR